MNLRKRIADSAWFNRTVEAAVAGWIRLAHDRSSWRRIGFEPMDAALRAGEPVIVALWHQRLMMSPWLFDTRLGRICSLTSGARAGRLAGQVQARFGFGTIAMHSNRRHVALSREVLGRIRDGWSIGIATDGPRGPARVASTVPLVWARASGCRIFLVAFSADRILELPTWDRMWLPVPFSRGVLMCREWSESVPRKPDEAQMERLRRGLENALNDLTEAADRAAGRAPAP